MQYDLHTVRVLQQKYSTPKGEKEEGKPDAVGTNKQDRSDEGESNNEGSAAGITDSAKEPGWIITTASIPQH